MTRLFLPLLVALSACNTQQLTSNWFSGPIGATVLQPWDGSPFTEPIAFVSNSREGTIVPLDLKHATLLGDQAASPYLPPRIVATGDTRQLGDVAAWGEGDRVWVFGVDYAYSALFQAPYVSALKESGEPIPPDLAASEPVFVDVDESGDSVAVSGLLLRHGYTTTESWVLEYDGTSWSATGSRSGVQARTFQFGVPFSTDRRELDITLKGTATPGDRVEFRTDSGLVEHPLGARPLGLHRLEGSNLLVVGLWDEDSDVGSLVVWDMAARVSRGRLELGAGSQPWRFAEDGETGLLYVGDARLPQVYAIDLDVDIASASAVEVLPTAAPVADLAWVGSPGEPLFGELPYANLFVAPAGLQRVDVYDLLVGDWVDVNPLDAVVGGLPLSSPVVGLSASPEPVRLQNTSNEGARYDDNVVVVTTFDGSIRMLEGQSGCMAINVLGPRISGSTATDDAVELTDQSPTSDPVLYADPATRSAISPARCGGVVKDETWTLTYDEAQGDWRVEGSRSGEQATRARENKRYVTDDGGMSFIVLSGPQPSSEGDRFEFSTDDGVLRINEVDRGGNIGTAPLELPAPPLVFPMEAGPTGGTWDEDRTQIHALVPITGSDFVLRLRLQAWAIEVLYE